MADIHDPRPHSQKSTAELLSDAMTHVSGLMRKEIDLARAEINQAMSRAGAAMAMIAIGAILALVALNVLAAALVDAVAAAGIDAGWAALIVGVGILIVALILAMVGKNRLKEASLAPKRVAENVRKDMAAVKGATER